MALKTVAPGHFFIPAAPSKGTAVAQSASANTFGSYVQMIASTSAALYITGYFVDVLIDVNTVAPLYVDLNIGVGAAASEVTVDQARMPTIYAAGGAGTNNLRFGAFVPVIPPIPVAASARIAVKTASDFASAISWNVSLQCIAQADVVDAGINESADVQTIKTQAVTCSAGVTVSPFVGNATAALGVDASGRVDLGKWIGVAPLALTSQQVQAVVPDSQKVDVNTIKTNPVVNGGTITFPTGATLASTTNITAGTITTVTNLTNAPTNGDLTAAMKASVNAECDTALADYDGPTNAEMVARTIAAADYATAANLATVAAYLDTEIAAILEDTGTTLPAQIAALNNIAAADVWAVVTRTLTAGTNIVLAKGTGVTGFNDLSAAQVNAECDTALADYDGPTNAEMVARTLVAADYATTTKQDTINNNVVNSMSLITAIPATIITDHGAGSYVRNTEPDNTSITAIKAKTDNLPASPAAVGSAMTLDLTQAFTPADNSETVGGALAAARAQGFGKWALVGTTLTLYAADGVTAVRTFTLDHPTAPTSRT